MAITDFNSSTPIRSESDGLDSKVVVKLVDGTVGGSNQMSIDSDKNAHVEMHGNTTTGTDVVMRLSEQGSPNADGIYDVTNNTKPASSALVAQTRNVASSDVRSSERPTAKRGIANTDSVSLDIALHDENGDAYTQSNPMPVSFSNQEIGTPVHIHGSTAAPIVLAASDTVTYTVTGTPFTLKRIVASASGRCKIEIFTGPSATLVQKYTLFNSSVLPNVPLDVPNNFVVAVGDVVQVKFTNMDKQTFSGYATIEGMLA